MHRLSHSGNSQITLLPEGLVRKRAPDAVGQALFMGVLGEAVCPRVYYIGHDNYTMEALTDLPRSSGAWLIYRTVKRDLLERYVWCHDTPASVYWQAALLGWADYYAPWLEAKHRLGNLFNGHNAAPHWCRIHGDPTLANCMLRNGWPRLIDPLPPVIRVLPSQREVDLGKMLQSALGWEAQLDSALVAPSAEAACNDILLEEDGLTQARAWWWCAVHCARIMVRTKNKALLEWAGDMANYALSESNQCYSP